MASSKSLVIQAGITKEIPDADELIVGVGIDAAAAGPLTVGDGGVATSVDVTPLLNAEAQVTIDAARRATGRASGLLVGAGLSASVEVVNTATWGNGPLLFSIGVMVYVYEESGGLRVAAGEAGAYLVRRAFFRRDPGGGLANVAANTVELLMSASDLITTDPDLDLVINGNSIEISVDNSMGGINLIVEADVDHVRDLTP